MKKLYDRCMGECCKDIGLPVSPEELRISYLNWLSSKNTNLKLSSNNEYNKIYDSISLIYPMLTFIKKDYYHPEFPKSKRPYLIYHYTCKHFNNNKKLCSIYEIRPTMCKTYPNKEYCNNPKCKCKKYVMARIKFESDKKQNELLIKEQSKTVTTPSRQRKAK